MSIKKGRFTHLSSTTSEEENDIVIVIKDCNEDNFFYWFVHLNITDDEIYVEAGRILAFITKNTNCHWQDGDDWNLEQALFDELFNCLKILEKQIFEFPHIGSQNRHHLKSPELINEKFDMLINRKGHLNIDNLTYLMR